MKKKIICVLLSLGLMSCFTGCVEKNNEEANLGVNTNLFRVKESYDDNAFILVDKTTGVNYIYIKSKEGTMGYRGYGYAGLTPRYDSNGKLIIDKVE